jgi:hypothetical protein
VFGVFHEDKLVFCLGVKGEKKSREEVAAKSREKRKSVFD